jgi:MFS transporter, FHS family, L-fucose permease
MRMPDKNNTKFRGIPIFFTFPCMGFGDVVRPLVGLVKESLKVSSFQVQLMTFLGSTILGFLADQSTYF